MGSKQKQATATRRSIMGKVLLITGQGLLMSIVLGFTPTMAKESVKEQAQHRQALFKQVDKLDAMIRAGKLRPKDIPDPHWQADGCIACHKGKPTRNKLQLRTRDVNQLCQNCHRSMDVNRLEHPVGMKTDAGMLKRMSADFRKSVRKSGGKVSCLSCHDLKISCTAKSPTVKRVNPGFFRGKRSADRTDMCFECHDARQYERLNAHKQLTARGEIKESACEICHKLCNDQVSYRNATELKFNTDKALKQLCLGCHPFRPHPGGSFSLSHTGKGPDHLVEPSRDIRRQMKRAAKSGVELPMEPGTNKIYCGTCHEPHEAGVLKSGKRMLAASNKHRLREKEICIVCHVK